MPKVLIINSYAGSLTLGASALKQEIIGSYEDANFGLDIQKHNFPHLEFREHHHQWPKQDLSEVVVLAHPPCSAFSTLNTSPWARGTNSKAFTCTKKVLEYACSNDALAVAIESVVGALGGAWGVHQHYADAYGYHIYRVLQTGAMFSCQWRDRFWVILVKKGAAPETLGLSLTPRWRTVADVVRGAENGETFAPLGRELEKLKTRFRVDAGCTDDEMSYIFDKRYPHHPTCGVNDVLWRLKFPNEDRWDICQRYVGTFSCGQMVFLDPNGLAPTLLGGSWWYMNGRNVSQAAYRRIGGFPDNYVFPQSPRNYANQSRMYMSKGVIPAVAEWVLGQVLTHLGESPLKLNVFTCGCAFRSTHEYRRCPSHPWQAAVEPYEVDINPNMIADMRIRKREWGEPRPALRHEDQLSVYDRLERGNRLFFEPEPESEVMSVSEQL